VAKTLEVGLDQDVADFYNQTKTMRGVEHCVTADWNHEIHAGAHHLRLVPVCSDHVPSSQDGYRAAVRDVVCFLRDLHSRGWCHLDLRWSNLVYDRNAKVWTVIDCEFLRRIGRLWEWPEDVFTVEDPQHGVSVGVHTDYYLFGELLGDVPQRFRSGLDAAFRGENSEQLQSTNLEVRSQAFQRCVESCQTD
jgi:hypothetical protein